MYWPKMLGLKGTASIKKNCIYDKYFYHDFSDELSSLGAKLYKFKCGTRLVAKFSSIYNWNG